MTTTTNLPANPATVPLLINNAGGPPPPQQMTFQSINSCHQVFNGDCLYYPVFGHVDTGQTINCVTLDETCEYLDIGPARANRYCLNKVGPCCAFCPALLIRTGAFISTPCTTCFCNCFLGDGTW